jgi:predicted RNA-binding protein with PUA-like domain
MGRADVKMTLDSLEKKIVTALRTLDKRWRRRWSDEKSTREVKNAVGSVATDLGLTVHATGRRFEDNSEWLYDLCCCTQDRDGLVLDIPLAMECEWSPPPSALLRDFKKLLISRASHRVFLCWQHTKEDWRDSMGNCLRQVRLYRGTRNGDRYLFGCWLSDGWQFTQYVHPSAMPHATRVWLFQAKRERYDLTKELRRHTKAHWYLGRHRENLRPGNIALLWQSGQKAGIYGLGALTSNLQPEDGEWRVDIRYTKLLDQPILKSDLHKHPLLRKLGVINMPRGSNPFSVSDEEWQALKKMSADIRSLETKARRRRRGG